MYVNSWYGIQEDGQMITNLINTNKIKVSLFFSMGGNQSCNFDKINSS